jgi:hypothetical protein
VNLVTTLAGYKLCALDKAETATPGATGMIYKPDTVILFPDYIASPMLGTDEVDWAESLPAAILRAAQLQNGEIKERFEVRRHRANKAAEAKHAASVAKTSDEDDTDTEKESEDKKHAIHQSSTHPRATYRNTPA